MSASAEPEKAAAAAATEGEEKAEAKDGGSGGELLYCGATVRTMGQKAVGGGIQGNLLSPSRLRPLVGVDIRSVASGCMAPALHGSTRFCSLNAYTAACGLSVF